MHFTGMMAFRLPVPLVYDVRVTALSMVPAVLASVLALYVAGTRTRSFAQVLLAAMCMAIGICSMHYIGMAAIPFAPAATYSPFWIVASVVVGSVPPRRAYNSARVIASRTVSPPSQSLDSSAESAPTSICARHRPGRTTAGCSRQAANDSGGVTNATPTDLTANASTDASEAHVVPPELPAPPRRSSSRGGPGTAPEIDPQLAPGVAFDFSYSFRLEADRVAELQREHQQLCASYGPRCQVTGVFGNAFTIQNRRTMSCARMRMQPCET